MPRLAHSVHLADPAAQDQLLVEGVGPLAAKQIRSSWLEHFWFDRPEAGSPHLLIVLTVATTHLAAVRRAWNEALGELVSRLAPQEISPLRDREDGDDLFPWRRALAADDPLWGRIDDLTFWTIEQLEEEPQRRRLLAAAWMADLEGSLVAAGWDAKSLWRSCVLDLAPSGTLARGGPADVERAVAARLTPSQRAVLDRAWLAVGQYGGPWPQMRRLVEPESVAPRAADRGEGVPGEDGVDGESDPWPVLRPLLQAVLRGLGLAAEQSLSLLLHAWSYRPPEGEGFASEPASD